MNRSLGCTDGVKIFESLVRAGVDAAFCSEVAGSLPRLRKWGTVLWSGISGFEACIYPESSCAATSSSHIQPNCYSTCSINLRRLEAKLMATRRMFSIHKIAVSNKFSVWEAFHLCALALFFSSLASAQSKSNSRG